MLGVKVLDDLVDDVPTNRALVAPGFQYSGANKTAHDVAGLSMDYRSIPLGRQTNNALQDIRPFRATTLGNRASAVFGVVVITLVVFHIVHEFILVLVDG